MTDHRFDPSASLQFVVNGKAGSSDSDATRETIQSALRAAGRAGVVHFAGPGELVQVARDAAATALRTASAVVAVGGDGTINTVAQAAHGIGCTLGVIPEGTFNYFAREHGAPGDTAEALGWLLAARPASVQVPAINGRLFLVNASLGLYPDLLQDREKWTARFGRSRVVAFIAGISTLLRAQRRLQLAIESDQQRRNVRTLTLFVGNNQLQLEQLGLADTSGQVESKSTDAGITAVILKPIGTFAMLGLMLRGALGQLGEANGVERFTCQQLVVTPSSRWGGRRMKVAYDGEVTWMNAPLTFRVLEEPLWLLKSGEAAATS